MESVTTMSNFQMNENNVLNNIIMCVCVCSHVKMELLSILYNVAVRFSVIQHFLYCLWNLFHEKQHTCNIHTCNPRMDDLILRKSLFPGSSRQRRAVLRPMTGENIPESKLLVLILCSATMHKTIHCGLLILESQPKHTRMMQPKSR